MLKNLTKSPKRHLYKWGGGTYYSGGTTETEAQHPLQQVGISCYHTMYTHFRSPQGVPQTEDKPSKKRGGTEF